MIVEVIIKLYKDSMSLKEMGPIAILFDDAIRGVMYLVIWPYYNDSYYVQNS